MSTLDFRDLSDDRLTTTDAEGRRLWIIPAKVKGVWKTRKTVFHIVLLAIFILTPWLRYDGSPLVLFDVMNRQFVFFGHVFASHDAPLLFFVFGILGFSLIVATALWGRIWCGWACPQTVFIEQVYRRIESWVVGNRATQVAARKDPLQWKHFRKLTLKWILFVLVSTVLAHTFMAYFVSWEKLLDMMSRPPAESWTVFVMVLFFTGIILFDFAWFREQFCVIMCPYGRFQSVLLDQNSITVSYDFNRGEPRSRGVKKKDGAGDCIDCYKCVSVCPTGIDIRKGQQMECIGCTACIDACDEVMTKIGRPKGLVRYAALSELESGEKKTSKARLSAYLFVYLILIAGFVFALSRHEAFYYAILRQNQRPYVVTEQGLMNNFKVHFKNPTMETVRYELKVMDDRVQMAPPILEGEIAANGDVHRPFFLTLPMSQENGIKNVDILIRHQVDSKWHERIDSIKIVYPKN